MKNKSSGQIGLIVLLVMSVMLTLGVSTVSRSTQDLRITAKELETSRALNLAEAGIEAALTYLEANDNKLTGSTYNGYVDVGTNRIDYQITQSNEVDAVLLPSDTASVNVDSYPGTELSISFGPAGGTCSSSDHSLLWIVMIDDSGNREVSGVSSGCGGAPNLDANEYVTRGYNFQLTLPPNTQLVAIRSDNDTSVAVRVSGVGSDLPVQAHVINSSFTNASSGERRTIKVTKPLPAPVDLLHYALYTEGTINTALNI